jgi:hypothetical protein
MDSDSGFIERFPSWADIGDDEAKGCQQLCEIAVRSSSWTTRGMMTQR